MNDTTQEFENLFGERIIEEIQKPKATDIQSKKGMDDTILKLELNVLLENSKNSYIYLDEEDECQFANLKESIRTEGLIHPLVAKNTNGKYILISGHRRLKALK